jgi:hypothetical protein
MVAVLWSEDFRGKANIIGVFESERQARELIEHQHGERASLRGHYQVSVRPLTKYRGDVRLWP